MTLKASGLNVEKCIKSIIVESKSRVGQHSERIINTMSSLEFNKNEIHEEL